MRLATAAALALLFGASATAPAGARAALPVASAKYGTHDHATEGDQWHVEVEVSKDSRRLRSLVLYAERCDGATAFAQRVPVAADGAVVASGDLDPGDPGAGRWGVDARFVTRDRLEGVWRMLAPGCDTGVRTFTARRGHDNHRHDGDHSHHTAGPPMGAMPNLDAAPPRARRQAARLWRASRRTAARRFPTYAAARSQGYVRYPIKWRRPVVFHLRSAAYDRDRRILDPVRPESLVYYWPRRGEPVLIAFMFRAPAGRPPSLAAPLLAWHSHSIRGRRGRTQMSHIWLTGGLRSGLANCLPVRQLEATLPAFRFEGPAVGAAHESRPCPSSVK